MTLSNHELKLIVGGRQFGGWKEVRVSRGIEQAAGDFDIAATQRWPGVDERFEIPEGSPCEIWIGEDKVLTGYAEVISTLRSGSEASIQIRGRSKTADLIECSPDYEIAEMAGLDLAGVAKKLAGPFGIEVDARVTGASFPVASANHGETVWKVVERLARQSKVLVMDDEEGRLVLARLGSDKARDRLVHPADGLVSIGTTRDSSKRFSIYRVKAQAGGRWAPGLNGAGGVAEALAHIEGTFSDPGVTRYRPKTLLNEGAANKTGAIARAEWECRRNLGRALTVHATRVGWRQEGGELWRPNTLVICEVPSANVRGELALSKVSYRKGGQGTLCELDLSPPEAFTPEPPEAASDGTGNGLRWVKNLGGTGLGGGG